MKLRLGLLSKKTRSRGMKWWPLLRHMDTPGKHNVESKKSATKATNGSIPFKQNVQDRQLHRDREETRVVGPGREGGGRRDHVK